MNTWSNIIIAACLFITSLGANAAGEVNLLKAQSMESSYKGYWLTGKFEAQVKNLGYNKLVSIYLKTKDGSWVDYPLSYSRSGYNIELWSADFNLYTLPNTDNTLEFAVKYQVNGNTYWDNNGGNNYKHPKNGGSLLGNGFKVYNGVFSPEISLGTTETTWSGYATVQNIAYSKIVQVKYSTDGWATSKIANATYNPYFWNSSYFVIANPNTLGFEEWNFKLDVGNASQVEYAIAYSVSGQTYWDNNLGRNYYSRIVRF